MGQMALHHLGPDNLSDLPYFPLLFLASAALGSLPFREHIKNAPASKHLKPLSPLPGILFFKLSAMAVALLLSDLC